MVPATKPASANVVAAEDETTVASPRVEPLVKAVPSTGVDVGADPNLRNTRYPEGDPAAAVNAPFIEDVVGLLNVKLVGCAVGSAA